MAHSPRLDAAALLPSYASDTSGVCSALYELGGMTVVHDASGCNSTYSTFDEPRWWDMESLIFISGLTESDAVMGNDRKFLDDCVSAARELSPAFMTLCRSPMPALVGTDMEALARALERTLGIPVFAIRTNGMSSYLVGASRAWQAVLSRFCTEKRERDAARVNLLGATPLDITDESLEETKAWLRRQGYEPGVTLARGITLGELEEIPRAAANLVLSSSGLAAARDLEARFGQPCVAGIPFAFNDRDLAVRLERAVRDGKGSLATHTAGDSPKALVIGESVFAVSLAQALEASGTACRIYSPLETPLGMLGTGDYGGMEDEALAERLLGEARLVCADPFYRIYCPQARFIPCPHTAFSGRVFRGQGCKLFDDFLSGVSPC